MFVELDQSWKIEDTNKKTVIAFSNGHSGSVCISSKDKQFLQSLFRKAGKPEIFIYKVFAVLVFILIKDYLSKLRGIAIDIEYPGKEPLIKDYLMQLIRKYENPEFGKDRIWFKPVGKRSNSHKIAYGVFLGRIKPTKVISHKDVVKYLI